MSWLLLQDPSYLVLEAQQETWPGLTILDPGAH